MFSLYLGSHWSHVTLRTITAWLQERETHLGELSFVIYECVAESFWNKLSNTNDSGKEKPQWTEARVAPGRPQPLVQ